MKKILVVIALLVSVNSRAQFPIAEIIKAGIKKVIVAIDLKIQKLQNKTIWLQNAQKTLENTMSKLKLTEISEWVEKQRKLYDEYFQELWKVKAALAYYHRVKDIIEDQVAMVAEYKSAWATFRQDKNFNADELNYMADIYTGMMNESLKSLDQLFIVVNAFATQMSDAKRMEIINTAANSIEQNFLDLKEFNNQNKLISIQRAAAKGEIEYVKKLYGL
ncbi:conjugal transfer protein TraI [Chitinophagaceae bacterium IBVUCB2]|nr:conjugal transfer protein TraI [Chitinophagaceae bacterium IBVUCB2]